MLAASEVAPNYFYQGHARPGLIVDSLTNRFSAIATHSRRAVEKLLHHTNLRGKI